MMMARWTLSMAGVLLFAGAAHPEHSERPFLRLESGVHTAPIRRLDIDRSESYLVTGSEDKTARVWDLDSGALIQVLRPPISNDNEGKIFAVAISPDSRTVAAGGWTRAGDNSVYLFDRSNGRLARKIGGLPDVIQHLTFDRQGSLVAAVLGGGQGLRVFRTDGALIFEDTDYVGASYGADFAADGRLVTTAYDGRIRLYDARFETVRVIRSDRSGSQPGGVAFSPDDLHIAVAYSDVPHVDVLSSLDLSLVDRLVVGELRGFLSAVAWSERGDALFAAGSYGSAESSKILRWPYPLGDSSESFSGRPLPGAQFHGSGDSILALRSLSDRRIAFAAADSQWGILRDGEVVVLPPPAGADFRNAGQRFQIDPAAIVVTFAFGASQEALTFSIPERELVAGTRGIALAADRVNAIQVSDWQGSQIPRLDGRPIPLDPYETSQSLAIAADGRHFLLGTSWRLRYFTRTGEPVWQQRIPSSAWGVRLSADGGLAVAALGDGTIRWYRTRDGQELLAFFPHADRKRWVIWTPSGYYDTSIAGENLIGWHLNNGPDRAASFYPVSYYRERFHRPDVVDLVLETRDERHALKRADLELRPHLLTPLAEDLRLPTVEIVSPAEAFEARSSPIGVRVLVATPPGRPITAVKAFVDGRPVLTTRAIQRVEAGTTYTLQVPIPRRHCVISVIAESGTRVSEPQWRSIRWAGALPASGMPKLFLLAVGVSEYQDPKIHLDYAAKDARDVFDAWQEQKGRLYRDVSSRLLTDADATKERILEEFDWLVEETGQQDTAILFFAGHGIKDERTQDYFFLGHDADVGRKRVTMIPGYEIRNALSSIRGTVILFLDSCHAGRVTGPDVFGPVDVTRLVNELQDPDVGVVVFSASTSQQLSRESHQWENGAFTEALLAGLAGEADLDDDRQIFVDELGHFLDRRVRDLTRELQIPTAAKPVGVPNFPVARLR